MENIQLVHAKKNLGKWRGADGQFVSYEPTLQLATLAFWFELAPDRGFLQLSLSGCSRISLPVKWNCSSMNIADLDLSKQFKIEDPTLGILIVCSEVNATPRREKFWLNLQ